MHIQHFEHSESKASIRDFITTSICDAIFTHTEKRPFIGLTFPGKHGFQEVDLGVKFLKGDFLGKAIELHCFESDKRIFNSNGTGVAFSIFREALSRFLGNKTNSDELDERIGFEACKRNFCVRYFFRDTDGKEIAGFSLFYYGQKIRHNKFDKIDFAWVDYCGIPDLDKINNLTGFYSKTAIFFTTFMRNERGGTRHPKLPRGKKITATCIKNLLAKISGIRWDYCFSYLNGMTPMATLGYNKANKKPESRTAKKAITQNETHNNAIKNAAVKLMRNGTSANEISAGTGIPFRTLTAWLAWDTMRKNNS